jgi:DNA polymerase-3 subunit epsilon/ATP-dependent DNA helicase DinG
MKGRGNYLCPRRLAAARRRRPSNSEEMRTLAKILVWLLESTTGDRGEITLRGPEENATWNRLSADDEGCTMERCQTMMGGVCPFFKARKAAESAHVLIVNHALLIADAATENRALPDYRYLVIDEGHHLEDATTNGMSFRLDENTLRRRLSELGGPRRGLLGTILTQLRGVVSERDLEKLSVYVEDISTAIAVMDKHITAFFDAVRALLKEMKLSASDYSLQVRVVEQTRSLSAFTEIRAAWKTLEEFVDGIGEALRSLVASLSRFSESIEDFDDLVTSVSTAARYLGGVHQHIEDFANQPGDNTIYWISAGQDLGHLALNSAPLHVGPLVEEHIWNAKESVIVTSATLQTSGSFEYLRSRLNADSVRTVELGSPFDYRASTMIYIPRDMPDPSKKSEYQHAVERGIIELAAALEGRVLALFTSYAQLRQTANAIAPRLALGGITVYDQSDGSSRQALLDGFKTSERAVLLGTRSFWEGVDIPGEALSALVIVKLPFSVPTEPVFAARSETVPESFNNFTLPDAILRFRQGFGRLIRTKTDRGIVTIFDSRVLTKPYGSSFLESLPDCVVERGPLNSLPEASVAWLDRPRPADK